MSYYNKISQEYYEYNVSFTQSIHSEERLIGVKVMLAGGIGEGAINVLKQHGIAVVRGCSGDVKTLAQNYLAGQLTDSGETCAHHDHNHGEDHVCNH